MKKIFSFFLCLLVVGGGALFAQTLQIKGVVTDASDGSTLPGAFISVKGTNTVTSTLSNGEYTIAAPSNAVLVFSFIGMETQEVSVNGRDVINVALATSNLLEEVVVTGYGMYRKGSFTGSASTVTTEKIRDIPTVSIQDRLRGAVAGVFVTSTSGQPGAVEDVRIRGLGSINASRQPLYVLNGVPILSGDISGFGYSNSGTSQLSLINSNDIESITVLKDAAASALYGSRAANGVVVITTKSGKDGKTLFSFKADMGFSKEAVDFRPVLGGDDRREILHLGLYNYRLNSGYSDADSKTYADNNINTFASKPWNGWTQWKDYLWQTGNRSNAEFSLSGGNERTNYYASLSYTNQRGITAVSGYERFTGNINFSHRVKNFSFNGNMLYSQANQDLNSEGTSFSNPIMAVSMTCSPSDYPYNQDGTLNVTQGFAALGTARANPLQSMDVNWNRGTANRILSRVTGQYDIVDGLFVRQVLSFDRTDNIEKVWWDPTSNDGTASQGVMQYYAIRWADLYSQSQVGYVKNFGEHFLDVLASYEVQDYQYGYIYANGNTYPNSLLYEIGNAGNTRASSSSSSYAMLSYVGRVDYNYAGKYYLGGSFRRDGSSRLGSERRWGSFWSASASWRITAEQFMKPLTNVLSDAKLRASYGISGTLPNNYYDYMGVFGYGYNYSGNPGSRETRVPNAMLTWEKNTAFDIGLELTFLRRFTAIIDWYTRTSDDLLLDKPISRTTGFTTTMLNVGQMKNRGLELELKSINLSKKDFFWQTTISLSHNKNEITRLIDETGEISPSAAYFVHKVGSPYFTFNVFEYAGVDPETGRELFYKNRPGVERETTTNVAEADQTVVGTFDPDLSFGLTNYMSWKFIDFNFTLTGMVGGLAIDNTSWIHSDGGTYHYYGNVPAWYDIDKTWKKPGDRAELPQFRYGGTSQTNSSRWLVKTDHLRVKNITIGITLPKQWISKTGMEKVRLYASGVNVLTWKDKALDSDPEVAANGMIQFRTPPLKSLTFGLEINF